MRLVGVVKGRHINVSVPVFGYYGNAETRKIVTTGNLSTCIVSNFELKYLEEGWGSGPPALVDSDCNVNGLVMHRDFAKKLKFKVKSYAKNEFKPPVTFADDSPLNITGKIDQVLFCVENKALMPPPSNGGTGYRGDGLPIQIGGAQDPGDPPPGSGSIGEEQGHCKSPHLPHDFFFEKNDCLVKATGRGGCVA